jgi:hypothetical protein
MGEDDLWGRELSAAETYIHKCMRGDCFAKKRLATTQEVGRMNIIVDSIAPGCWIGFKDIRDLTKNARQLGEITRNR